MFPLIGTTKGRFTLVHVPNFLGAIKAGISPTEPPMLYNVCAGTIVVGKSENNECLGAYQVNIVAGSPKFPGAGSAMYAFASEFYGAPLTSDRKISSSPAAKRAWTKIETSGDWTKVGQGLDNYGGYPRKYVRFSPDHKVLKITTEPATPDEHDDCPLPTKGDDDLSVKKMASLLGTPDAYTYKGSLQAKPLVTRGKEILLVLNHKQTKMNPHNLPINQIVDDLGKNLFHERYTT